MRGGGGRGRGGRSGQGRRRPKEDVDDGRVRIVSRKKKRAEEKLQKKRRRQDAHMRKVLAKRPEEDRWMMPREQPKEEREELALSDPRPKKRRKRERHEEVRSLKDEMEEAERKHKKSGKSEKKGMDEVEYWEKQLSKYYKKHPAAQKKDEEEDPFAELVEGLDAILDGRNDREGDESEEEEDEDEAMDPYSGSEEDDEEDSEDEEGDSEGDSDEDEEEELKFPEDQVIAHYEKLLGKKRGRQSTVDDGLDELLDGLEDEAEDFAKRYEEGDESDGERPEERVIKGKRSRKRQAEIDAQKELEEEEEEKRQKAKSKRKKEREEERKEREGDSRSGPSASSSSSSAAPTKYIPPHLRAKAAAEAAGAGGAEAVDAELQRQMRGMTNRVSENNISVIVEQCRDLFDAHTVREMSNCMAEVLIKDCFSKANAHGTMMPTYAALVAAMHYLVGTDVGGVFLNRLALAFEREYKQAEKLGCVNLVKLLAQLYSFQVVHCTVVYDMIRTFLANFRELDVELLLSLLRVSGPQLRSDDPSALKEIILTMQKRSEETQGGQQDGNFSLRVKIMLDMIYDLKNNKTKKSSAATAQGGATASGRLVAMIQKLRKGSQAEQLKASWEDIVAAAQRRDITAKWWLKGGMTFGDGHIAEKASNAVLAKAAVADKKLMQVARAQGMNTDVRRAIFVAIMRSQDFMDCFEQLSKLPLKGKQDREIVHVIMRCCSKERVYNPFYGHLSSKLCSFDFSHKFTFQFAFWDRFRQIGDMTPTELTNLAKLLAQLISSFALSLSVLKAVDFVRLSPEQVVFFRVVFLDILEDISEPSTRRLVKRIVDQPELQDLRDGLLLFLRHGFKGMGSDDFRANLKYTRHLLKQVPMAFE